MVFRLHTLKKRADFLRARQGRYHAAPGLILQASRVSKNSPNAQNLAENQAGNGESPEAGPRFGFTATKKLGNAVVRNRIKRRLREAVRLIAPQMARDGYEYVLIGRQSTLKRPFKALLDDLVVAFQRVHGPLKAGRNRPRGGKPGRDRKVQRRSEPKSEGEQGRET